MQFTCRMEDFPDLDETLIASKASENVLLRFSWEGSMIAFLVIVALLKQNIFLIESTSSASENRNRRESLV
jgi:hypothetical protein